MENNAYNLLNAILKKKLFIILINLIFSKKRLVFPKQPAISDKLKDLVNKMLEKNPDHRISIDEIAEHPWITQYNSKF